MHVNLVSRVEFTYKEFKRLLYQFLRQQNRLFFTREELLAFIVSRGYDVSYYKLRKLLRQAVEEGLLAEQRKKEVRKSEVWGLPIYRVVYVPRRWRL